MNKSRSDLEADLAAALSRHIGYTTGAYQIDRIASIAAQFHDRPSLYQFELTHHLQNNCNYGTLKIDESYATQILNFAVGLGIIYKVSDGPTSRVNRFALTPEGATIRSALMRGEHDLVKFTLIGLVLESDCDAYILLLEMLDETCAVGSGLHTLFRDRFLALRNERANWLENAFPSRMLQDRIASKTTWFEANTKERNPSTRKIKALSTSFGRHHVTPRLGWARWFEHIEAEEVPNRTDLSPLTPRGLELLEAVRGESPRYVWLGPPEGTQEALRIPAIHQRPGPCSPSWELMRPTVCPDSEGDIETLVNAVAEFMYTHYDELKLVHADQASVRSVLPYLYLEEWKMGYQVSTKLVLNRIFGPGSSFSLLSTRHTKYGYYQLRAR